MAVENDFLLFANTASNIESQTNYAADAIVPDGFSAGTAPSAKFNKVFRQATTGMALLALFIQQQIPTQTVLDTGEAGLTTLLASLTAAFTAFVNDQKVTQSSVIASVGATLTAAQMLGRPMAFITRSGPTANFSDTTDTAANIVAALVGAVVGTGFMVRILNTTTVVQTIAGGSGVTVSGTATIAAGAWRDFVGDITDVTSPVITLTSQGGGTN